MKERVILIDDNDNETGYCDKLEAHQKNLKHRALSVFIFNSKKEFLLQKRAENKYHSPGLWTNTCCGHPRPGERTLQGAQRRLKEEMGMDCNLEKVFDFSYQADFKNGLFENEFDHVYFGFSDALPVINKEEASDWKFLEYEILKKETGQYPEKYTAWFKICLEIIESRNIFGAIKSIEKPTSAP